MRTSSPHSILGMDGSTWSLKSRPFSFALTLGTFTLASRAKLRDEGTYQQSFEAPEAHILVVDDNEMNLMVVTSTPARSLQYGGSFPPPPAGKR